MRKRIKYAKAQARAVGLNGLGVDAVTLALESSGLSVTSEPFRAGVLGVLVAHHKAVIVRSDLDSKRRVVVMALLLGRHLLHGSTHVERGEGERSKEGCEATAFALELLAPPEEVQALLDSYDACSIHDVAEHFHLTPQAAALALHEAGALSLTGL